MERERAGAEIEALLRSLLKGEHSSIHIGFNDEISMNYTTVAEAVSTYPDHYDGWVSPEERQKAIETNCIWTLQCYPNSPVGFFVLRASSLSALLAAICKEENPCNGRGADEAHHPPLKII